MSEVKINFSKKYISKHPISQKLIKGFSLSLEKLLTNIDFNNHLDIGSGEGIMLHKMQHILKNKDCYGIDVDKENLKFAKNNFPTCTFSHDSIYQLHFKDLSFDLVTCLEVLEHLEEPERGMSEIQRVARKYIILSVPNEPLWSFLNMARFKYWKSLGNTPGHLNRWSAESFHRFVEGYFFVDKILKPWPWTMLLCRTKDVY